MNICIFGAASPEIDQKYMDLVEELGYKLAQNGHCLVYGAGGNGVMGAAARGFTRGGGKIFGVIPKFFRDETVELIYDKCEELIFTDTMAQRKSKMEDLADAFIIAPGGIGTFEEFFEVLTLKQLGRHTKPIVLYNIDGYYDSLQEFIKNSISKNFIKEMCTTIYGFESDMQKVIEYIEADKQIKHDVHELKNG